MDPNGLPEQRRAIVAGIAGNVMEWYDFSVYGYFAAVIGRQFFPARDPTSSLLAAFGVFAAGFLSCSERVPTAQKSACRHP